MTRQYCLGTKASLLLSAGLIVIGFQSAQAQTASQIDKNNYAPSNVQKGNNGLVLPASSGLEVPHGADALFVTPSGLEIVGGFEALAGRTAEIEARLKGQRVSAAQLFEAASELEQAYAQEGYLLVRVTMPPQTIKDGNPLRLMVTDGYLVQIDTSSLPKKIRRRIASILKPLKGQSGLTRTKIERHLLLAGDVPGASLKSTLKRGETPGSAKLIITGHHKAQYTSLSVDNSGSQGMERWQSCANLQLNTPFGFGETFYALGCLFPGRLDSSVQGELSNNRQLVLGMTTPIGDGGLWFGLEATDIKTHPKSTTAFTIPNDYQRLSARLGYQWIRGRNLNLSSMLSFDIQNEKQTLVFGNNRSSFTEDRVRVLRSSHSLNYDHPKAGKISASVVTALGVDAFNARFASTELPLSRTGAAPTFRKLNASLSHSRTFGGGALTWSNKLTAQTSFGDALVSSEQFILTGQDGLSGLSDSLAGDSGVSIRSEASVAALSKSFAGDASYRLSVTPYIFGAYGVAKLFQPTTVEKSVTHAHSFGLGTRVALDHVPSSTRMHLSMDYARGKKEGDNAYDNRLNFSMTVGF